MKCNLKSKILAFLASGAVALNLFNSPVFAVTTYLHTLLEDTSKLVTVDDVRKVLDEYPTWLDELDDKDQSPLYIAVHRKMDTVRDFLISRGANKYIALGSAVYNRDSSSVRYFLDNGVHFDACIDRYTQWIWHQPHFNSDDEFILGMLLERHVLPWKLDFYCLRGDPCSSCLYVAIESKCTDHTRCDCAFVALNRLRRDAGLPELEYKERSICIIA